MQSQTAKAGFFINIQHQTAVVNSTGANIELFLVAMAGNGISSFMNIEDEGLPPGTILFIHLEKFS